MAPPIQKVRLPNVVYNVEIISGEMDSVYQQLQSKQESIGTLQTQLSRENRDLVDLQTQLMTLFVQQTGTFPSAV